MTKLQMSEKRSVLKRVMAAIAAVAMILGINAYPAAAQETPAEEATETPTATVTETPSSTSQAPKTDKPTPTTKTTTPAAPKPVSVKRKDDVDTITVKDPTGEEWGWGAKASNEDVFALKRIGDCEIKEILEVVADGKKLEPKFYGFYNGDRDSRDSYVAFDIEGLDEIPPRSLELKVRTTRAAEYEIAENDEVPSKEDLAESGFGVTEDEGAQPAPQAINGTTRQANSIRPLNVTRTSYWNQQAFGNNYGFANRGRGAEVIINEGGPGNTAYVHAVRIHYKKSDRNNSGGALLLGKKKTTDFDRRTDWENSRACSPASGYKECFEFPISGPLDFWSGNNMGVFFKGASANRDDYFIEVLGRTDRDSQPTPQPPVQQDYRWSKAVDNGELVTTATNATGKGRSDVVMTRTIDTAQKLSGPFDATLTHNGFDLNSDVKPQVLRIVGPNGDELYRASGEAWYTDGVDVLNDWGGVRFAGPKDLKVPAGSKVIVEMNFNNNNRKPVVDSSVKAPVGPGALTFGAVPDKTYRFPNQRISVCAQPSSRTPLTGFKIVPNREMKSEMVSLDDAGFVSAAGASTQTDVRGAKTEIDGNQMTARYANSVQVPGDAAAHCAVITVNADEKIDPNRVSDYFVISFEHNMFPNEPDAAFQNIRVEAPNGWDKPTQKNPNLPERCGQNIAIVMDASNSVIVEGGVDPMANAARRIVDTLEGTGTSVGIYNFGSHAPRFNDAQISSTPIQRSDGADKVRQTIENYRTHMQPEASLHSVGVGATNWEAALKQIQQYNEVNPTNRYDAVYFVTDGFPTFSDAGEGKTGGAEDSTAGMVHTSDVTRARDAADAIKKQGTYIQPVMVNVDPDFKEPVAKDSTVPFYRVDAYRKAQRKLPGDIVYLWGDDKTGTFVRNLLNEGAMDIFGVDRNITIGQGFGDVLASPHEPQPQPDMSRPKKNGQIQLDDRDWKTWAVGERTASEVGNVIGDDNAKVARSFAELDALLAPLALANCTGSVTVSKSVLDSNGKPMSDPRLSGWEFTATTPDGLFLAAPAGATGRVASKKAQTDATGQVEFQLATDTPNQSVRVNVAETPVNGFTLFPRENKNAQCTVRYADGRQPTSLVVENLSEGFMLTAHNGEIITCSVSNKEDSKQMGFRIDKVDQDGKPIDGARFDVYRASNPTGAQFTGEPVWSTGSTSQLEPGGYVLVERQAPSGYSLLPRPVRFNIVKNGGVLDVEVEDGASFVVGKGIEDKPTTVFLKVANVLKGEMPKTGGIGIGVTTLLAMLIIGSGGVLLRRRSV